MKRRILSVFLALVTLSAFVGCDLAELTGKGNDNNQANLVNEPATDPEPVIDETEENKYEGVSNNGGNFVGVDGKIYFRQYAEYGIETTSSIRHFISSNIGGYGNTICYFTPEEPDKITAVTKEEDCGAGPLYYYDDYIYSTKYNWENGIPSPYAYRVSLSTGNFEDLGKGYIKAVSEDGKYILTEEYDSSEGNKYVVYEAGKMVGRCTYTATEEYNSVIAVDSDSIYIFTTEWENCDGIIRKYDYINNVTYTIGIVKAPDTIDPYITFSVIKDAKINNDTLDFTVCYCEGVEDYVEDAYDVSVNVKTDSNSSNDTVEYANTVKNSTYKGKPADEFDIPNNLSSLENFSSGDDGYSRAIQCVETVYDKTFAMVADCFYSAMWNQAQMGTYQLLDLDYYYFDDSNTTPILFNDDNPTTHTLIVRAWFVGKKGEKPEKLLFQHASLSGPEGPQEFDQLLYTAEFSDDFKFVHVPENGDIYDDFETDDMDYMVKYYNDDYYNPYVEKLVPTDEFTNYEVPKMDWNDPNSTTFTFLHVGFDRNGKINYIRQVIMD